MLQAYPLQKTAYRRANGGSGSPGVHEEVLPKFVTSTVNIQERLEQEQGPKLVVRKTFIDVEDDLGGCFCWDERANLTHSPIMNEIDLAINTILYT